MIAEQLRNVDAVCEILDARIPVSSRNPDVDQLTAGKPRLVVLNRVDQADPEATKRWAAHFRAWGYAVLETNARDGAGTARFAAAVRELLADKLRAYAEKGQAGRVVRVMVLGIPNVGKSTFINSFAGKACTKTGNKPGVTRGNQWIRLNRTLELLDTPGILWPKFEAQQVGLLLAFIGSINDEILNREELALELIRFLTLHYPDVLEKRYGVCPGQRPADPAGAETSGTRTGDGDGDTMAQAAAVLDEIARLRGCLRKGGETDPAKAAGILLDDFRSGKLGRITLEWPDAGSQDGLPQPGEGGSGDAGENGSSDQEDCDRSRVI